MASWKPRYVYSKRPIVCKRQGNNHAKKVLVQYLDTVSTIYSRKAIYK